MEKKNIFKLGEYLAQLEVVSVEETKVVDLTRATPAANLALTRDASTRESGDISMCNSCKQPFSNTDEQRQHYQSKWHLFNVKLRAAGLQRISESEFKKVEEQASSGQSFNGTLKNGTEQDEDDPFDLQETKDQGAISQVGSTAIEAEVSEVVNNSSPKVTFYAKTSKGENVALSLWKLALLPKVRGDHHVQAYLKALRESPTKDQWAVFMCTGGYFAGAVFRQREVLQHKRIARYTVRRKQGGAQGAHDSAGRNAQSAGAHIRRMNEKKLKEEIAEIMTQWKPLLDGCCMIFLFAPSYNRWSFIYEGSPIQKDDPRLRSIPFTTKRPSFMELKRVHEILSTVMVGPAHQAKGQLVDESLRNSTDSFISSLSESVGSYGSTLSISSSTIERDAVTGEVAEEEDLTLSAVRANDLERIKQLLDEGYEQLIPHRADADMHTPLSLAYELGNMALCKFLIEDREDTDVDFRVPQQKFRTVLHQVASKNDEAMVTMLLENGADPTIKDLHDLTPYDLAKEKEARMAFRRFAGENPDVWDYTAAKIPPLTKEQEAEKKAKDAQKKKKKKHAAKEKKKEQKQQEQAEQERRQREEEERRQAQAVRQARLDTEQDRDAKLMTMSEREKRALAAERRLAAMTGKGDICAWCGKQLVTVPFERLNFKYCSTACVVQHKNQLEGK